VPRTRIKICGITRSSDAFAAVEAGADALGLVFYPGSPRAVTVGQAEAIVAGLPPMVTLVGLFVNASATQVDEACSRLPLGLLQFHGDEPAEFCGSFGLPWMKALRIAEDSSVPEMMQAYTSASAILLDTWRAGVPGGTGESFNWQLVPSDTSQALVLAGGLNAENVASAIRQVQPFAVDVSGGVEASAGIKDVQKISEFIEAVRTADRVSDKN
jgi:phosphoribosylanthranilate isomerase